MIALDINVLLYACDRADSRRQQIAIDLVANSKDGVLLWAERLFSRMLRSAPTLETCRWGAQILHSREIPWQTTT
jgi:hypothetical protein